MIEQMFDSRMPEKRNLSGCLVCGKQERKTLFIARGCRYVRCRDCGFIRMDPVRMEEPASEDYSGFDLGSLDLRMDYLPQNPALRTLVKAALFLVLKLSSVFAMEDELVLLARKNGKTSKSPGNRSDRVMKC